MVILFAEKRKQWRIAWCKNWKGNRLSEQCSTVLSLQNVRKVKQLMILCLGVAIGITRSHSQSKCVTSNVLQHSLRGHGEMIVNKNLSAGIFTDNWLTSIYDGNSFNAAKIQERIVYDDFKKNLSAVIFTDECTCWKKYNHNVNETTKIKENISIN